MRGDPDLADPRAAAQLRVSTASALESLGNIDGAVAQLTAAARELESTAADEEAIIGAAQLEYEAGCALVRGGRALAAVGLVQQCRSDRAAALARAPATDAALLHVLGAALFALGRHVEAVEAERTSNALLAAADPAVAEL